MREDLDLIAELEAEIQQRVHGGTGRWRRPRRYASDGYAQGLLLDHLECLGFEHRFLAPLILGVTGPAEPCHGSRFTLVGSGRYVQCYHRSAEVALISAAALALRACDRILDAQAAPR